MSAIYSEHLIANLLPLATDRYETGEDLDHALGRVSVTVGRLIGLDLGCNPNDAALTRQATTRGAPAPVGTRGAVHLLPDGRTGMGLGPARGVIESAGDRLGVVRHPEPGRYTGVFRLPTINYGGLI